MKKLTTNGIVPNAEIVSCKEKKRGAKKTDESTNENPSTFEACYKQTKLYNNNDDEINNYTKQGASNDTSGVFCFPTQSCLLFMQNVIA